MKLKHKMFSTLYSKEPRLRVPHHPAHNEDYVPAPDWKREVLVSALIGAGIMIITISTWVLSK